MNAEYKATKIQKGSKTFVVVTDARGNEVARMGGSRAERAQAVVLTATSYYRRGELLKTSLEAGCRVTFANANYAAESAYTEFRDYPIYDGTTDRWVSVNGVREGYAIRID